MDNPFAGVNRQYVGARYVPKFFSGVNGSTEWVQGVQYEPMTIVTYLNNSYTSKIPVPAGVGNPAENTKYWANTGNFNAQLAEVKTAVDSIVSLGAFVTPQQFGAIGDGVADDTLAIQSAINAAIAGFGVVVFPSAKYLVSSALTCNTTQHTVSLVGYGNDSLSINYTGNGDLFLFPEESDIKQTIIYGLRVKGAGAGNAIHFKKIITNCKILNCSFYDFYSAILTDSESDEFNVSNCYFAGGTNDINTTSASTTNWLISSCQSQSLVSGGAFFTGYGNHITLLNDVVQSTTPQSVLNISGGGNITISNLYHEVLDQEGLSSVFKLANCSNVVCDNSSFHGVSAAIFDLNNVHHVVITNSSYNQSGGTTAYAVKATSSSGVELRCNLATGTITNDKSAMSFSPVGYSGWRGFGLFESSESVVVMYYRDSGTFTIPYTDYFKRYGLYLVSSFDENSGDFSMATVAIVGPTTTVFNQIFASTTNSLSFSDGVLTNNSGLAHTYSITAFMLSGGGIIG